MNSREKTGSSEPKRSSAIKYIDPVVPGVKLPAYSGQRYEAMVPDTLDLEGMASLAINGLTGPTDPDADYEIYWWVVFNTNPPMMGHAESDIVQAKHIEALPLLRLASGSGQSAQVEQRWMEVMRQMQAPDGLLYMPKIGRPWCAFGEYGKEPPGDHYFSPWFEGRLLGAMTVYYLLTGDAGWMDAGRRVVDGMNRLVLREGNKAHFACHEFGTEGRFTPLKNPSDAILNTAACHSWAIQGLANYYRYTGYQPAIELSARLSRWVREDSGHFTDDGRFLEEYPGVEYIHFHAHTMVLLSLLDYGMVAKDKDTIEFVRRGFEYGMTQGECLLGYFKEWLNAERAREPKGAGRGTFRYGDRAQLLEMCELAEMISLAVKLSCHGAGDYWDMADRWVRNLFTEGQLRHADWVYWMAGKSAPSVVPPYYTTERPIERNIGSFGYLSPNDFFPDRFPSDRRIRDSGIMHCCTGNGARTIYYVWENILTCKDGKLQINLLLNRASRWADIDSHVPYTGQVDVKVKEPSELSIRIPEWVKPEETVCTVNDREHAIAFAGRYALVGRMKAGDIVTLKFPIAERSEWVNIERRTYRVLLRGNTCVAIDPPGVNCPLFQRGHYRCEGTRWRKITRFVADKEMEW